MMPNPQSSRAARLIIIIAILGLPLIPGCGSDETSSPTVDDGRCFISASIAPHEWLVRQLGGTHIRSATILRRGESPATYQPTDHQVTRIMKCALYIRAGVPFEEGNWYNALADADDLTIVDTREGLTLRTMAAHHHEEGEVHDHGTDAAQQDPHIWTSPLMLKAQAKIISAALIEQMPEHKDELAGHLDKFEQRMDEIHATIAEMLEPYKGRTFIVFHPAWGYFADEFGLIQHPIEIEGASPSDQELTEILNLAQEHSIKYIFVQPQISSRAAEAVAEAIGGRLVTIDPLEVNIDSNLMHVAQILAATFEDQAPATSPAENPDAAQESNYE